MGLAGLGLAVVPGLVLVRFGVVVIVGGVHPRDCASFAVVVQVHTLVPAIVARLVFMYPERSGNG